MRRWTQGAGAVLAALSLPGCWIDDRSWDPSAAPALTVAAGDFAVRIDPAARDLALVRGDEILLDFEADALQLGVLPTVDDQTNYDPIAVVSSLPLHPPPDDLRWLSPARVEVTETDATSVKLTLRYTDTIQATLRVEAGSAGSFALTLSPGPGVERVAYLRLAPRADAAEAFYGLGEHFDDVNQRGHVRAMQIELEAGKTETVYNNVHVPVPFLVGTRGWGLFVESRHPGVFSVATTADDRIEALFGTGTASKDGLRFHLFGERRPLDLPRHYHEVTGRPALPARWALGPWVWRDESDDQAQAEGDLRAMRELDLPATGYWIDRPYATAVNTFDWKASQFPDPQALADRARDLGFALAIWHVPVLDEDAPETAELRAEAKAKGYYPAKDGLQLNPWGGLLDLTRPEAASWWQGLLGNYTAMGVEGYKLDYAEDVVVGFTAGRNVWEFADGSDERTMHAGYPLFYHATYAATLPGPGFLLCRHSTYGGQALGAIIWPGDLDASFAKNQEPAKDWSGETYLAVGGLPASVVAGLSLGASGFPFFGADTGGYLHSPPDKELFARWFEQTALSTVMQIGNSANTVAWEPDPKTGYDDELLGWYRTYTRLHLRLFPYEWTYAERLVEDGRPIARPLGLAYPELGQHPSDTYLFGDVLLVAPVLERGATSRPVLLPPGGWVDWWTGEHLAGGGTVTAAAPLGTLPLYLQEGGIVPMLRPTIDTLRSTGQPSLVDSYATDPGVLWARVAPGPASSFTVFDGAELAQERGAEGVTLRATSGHEFTSGVMFEVIGLGSEPAAVTEGGAALARVASLAELTEATSGWTWSADVGGTVHVKVPPGPHTVLVTP